MDFFRWWRSTETEARESKVSVAGGSGGAHHLPTASPSAVADATVPYSTVGSSSGTSQRALKVSSRTDYLYRAMYLRREFALLSVMSSMTAPPDSPAASPVPGMPTAPRTDNTTLDAKALFMDLTDVVLLPPDTEGSTTLTADRATAVGAAGREGIGWGRVEGDPMVAAAHAWSGLVYVRHRASPWYGGCFAFSVCFPSKYPFEAPIAEFAEPLAHPLLVTPRHASFGLAQRSRDYRGANIVLAGPRLRTGIPFEDIYCMLDPTKVSVMVRLVQHVKQLFFPTTWPQAWLSSKLFLSHADDRVHRQQARRDVAGRSVSQEVVMGNPFVECLARDVATHFRAVAARSTREDTAEAEDSESEDGDAVAAAVKTTKRLTDAALRAEADAMDYSEWYARSLLPQILQL